MKQIEVEGGELSLKNSFGDIVIIPKKDRLDIEEMIKNKCWGCIDVFVEGLPVMEDYAQDGSLFPVGQEVDVYTGDPKYNVKALAPRVGARPNADGTESTHVMAYTEADGKYYAYPTLYQDDKNQWIEKSDKDDWAAFNEAKKRNEVFPFDDKESAEAFAKGNWKGNYKKYNTSSDEYKTAYNSGLLTNYDPKTKTYIEPNLKEIEKTAKKMYDYKGCVTGLCSSLSEKYGESTENFRKLNNLYGDAWDINNNSYGSNVDISKGYSNLKEGDIVNLNREKFESDDEHGIPDKNQHVGYISKIVDGVPYVKHYISNVGTKSDGTPYGEYFEEPLNDIKEKFKYTPSGAKRLDYNKDIDYKDSNFRYDGDYQPNDIEEGVLKAHTQKKEMQKILRLTSDEYDELSKVAYGIMGNESSFGRSAKTFYRMDTPDFIQKGVKVVKDLLKGSDTYDDNINNLSQGYSSTKESSLHGVSSAKHENYAEVNDKIKDGDYTDLNRDNNYLYTVMGQLGINPDNLENGENSTKAIMATLAWYKKRNPNATTEELLKMYTGKKNISKYQKSFEEYEKNINLNPLDNKEYSWFDNLLGEASSFANTSTKGAKKLNSEVVSYLRDKSPLPENTNALFADIMSGKKDITEQSLSPSTLVALRDIVKNNLTQGKTTISYSDYGTSADANADVGGTASKNKGEVKKEDGVLSKVSNKVYGVVADAVKMTTDEKYILKTLLGQANIVKIDDNTYEIQDSFDFNDKGKSFGVIDDLKKRGYSPYAIVRALGRNYGSQDGQGSKVKIKIKIN